MLVFLIFYILLILLIKYESKYYLFKFNDYMKTLIIVVTITDKWYKTLIHVARAKIRRINY